VVFFRRHDERVTAALEQLGELDRRLAAATEENERLHERLASLEHRPLPAPTPPPDTADLAARVRALLGDPPPAIDPQRLSELEAAQDRIEHRLGEVTSVVSNQLSELGGELDALEHGVARQLADLDARLSAIAEASVVSSSASGNGHGSHDLDELRANQVRIANELARFSIAVREEMAALTPRGAPTPRT
jgi:hypothetical protein